MIWKLETLLGAAVGFTAAKQPCMVEDEDGEYSEEEGWVIQIFLGIIGITILFV